jgi:hypothetical protein
MLADQGVTMVWPPFDFVLIPAAILLQRRRVSGYVYPQVRMSCSFIAVTILPD